MAGTINTPAGSFEPMWRELIPVGAGLENKDGTCYANAILHCLTYTPPLANYLLYGEHSRTCQGHANCMVCAMEEHVKQVFSNPGRVIRPDAMLNLIGDKFKLGVQHGAYKYLMSTLDGIHESYLNWCRLNGQSVDSSLVQQIFEGCIQVTTTCESCGRASQDYKSYRALILDIEDVNSVPQALSHTFQSPLVCLKPGYRCRKSCQTSKTEKIHDLPAVLVIRLNRADILGRKVTKYVSYPETLNMSPFMSQATGGPEIYHLNGVLVHSGSASSSGHFYSHIKASDGKWYKMNDKSVSRSRALLKQQAYLLFYIRSPNPADERNTPEPTRSKTVAAFFSSAFEKLKTIPKMLRSARRCPKSNSQIKPFLLKDESSECEAEGHQKNQSAAGKTLTRTERNGSPLKKPTQGKGRRDPGVQESPIVRKRAWIEEDHSSSGQKYNIKQIKINSYSLCSFCVPVFGPSPVILQGPFLFNFSLFKETFCYLM